ncbi:MAG: class II aldolase/adducin family protein [Rickettsiaceae bacterium]
MTLNDKEIKYNLAMAYQILAMLNLDDHTYTHLSSLSSDKQHYYIYPFGMLFQEVTADNLLKVTLNGEVINGNECQYNSTGYIIHGSIYKARTDISSIFHLHTEPTVAVSAMKHGLIFLSQWSLHFFDKLAYHDYDSLALNHLQGEKLVSDLGSKNVIFLRNHGVITVGKTIHETMFYTYHLEKACKTQCLALGSGSIEDIVLPNEEICRKAHTDLMSFEKDIGKRDWNAWLRLCSKRNLYHT